MGLFDKLKKEESQDKLLEKINNDSLTLEVREEALDKLNDEKELFYIAKNEKYDDSLRNTAVRRISNQDLLLDIAASNDSVIDWVATNGLNQENLVLVIANRDTFSKKAREEALCFIDMPSIFNICAQDPDEDLDIRKSAIHKVRDKDLLFKIARNDDDPEIRKEIVQYGNLDRKALNELLKDEKDEEICEMIKRKKALTF